MLYGFILDPYPLFPHPCSFIPVPSSLFLHPCSFIPVPSSLFLISYSLFLIPCSFIPIPYCLFLLPSSFFLLPSSFFLFSSMKSYLAAAIQMTSVPDVDKNLTQAEEFIDLAVRRGAELVGLPENFAFMGDDEGEKLTKADTIASLCEKFLKTMAQRYQIAIVGGGFPVPSDNGKVYNTCLLIDKNGVEVARYEKVHLFDVNVPDGNTYQESSTVKAGTELPPVYASEELGKIGLSVCYDVRFPELYRSLSHQGAEILLVPAAFTAYTGKDHWKVLLQARAIENTCYVIAPAQTGRHNGLRQTHGHAMIIDPWGVILADAGDRPGVAIAEIDPNRLTQVRRQMPSLQHRVFV
jgi:deaminated glutathione amidase